MQNCVGEGVGNFFVATGDQGFYIFLWIQKPQRVTLLSTPLLCDKRWFTGRGLSGAHKIR